MEANFQNHFCSFRKPEVYCSQTHNFSHFKSRITLRGVTHDTQWGQSQNKFRNMSSVGASWKFTHANLVVVDDCKTNELLYESFQFLLLQIKNHLPPTFQQHPRLNYVGKSFLLLFLFLDKTFFSKMAVDFDFCLILSFFYKEKVVWWHSTVDKYFHTIGDYNGVDGQE